MRLTSLTAAALMGTALLAPIGTATAASRTCDGRPATIVGTPGGQITGTEGADVIVRNGATRVDALGGDDLVCATGEGGVVAILGEGADTFLDQNSGSHSVVAGALDRTDTDADVIRLARFGSVSTGEAGKANPDTIDIAGAAFVYWNGIQTAPGAVTVGKGGKLTLRPAQDVSVDAAGSVTGADTSLTWTGHFDEFDFATKAESGTFTFRGTDGIEHVKVDAPTTYDRDVALGGGNDSYETNGLGGKASWAKGNEGEDRLLLDLYGHSVEADLGRRVSAAGGKTATRIRGFESYAMSAKRVNVRGTNRSDRMDLIACQVRVNAGPGKDYIRHSFEYEEGDEWMTPRCGKYRAVIFGGRGRDSIYGGPGKDRLIGGPGKDYIDGGPKRDVCQGEKMRNCEKRI